MASEKLNNIFLSASIPKAERNKMYYDTADIIAIRDAVRVLATVVIPKANLIWGGHPSITPLIRYILDLLKVDIKSHVTLYQSLYFENIFPKDNDTIEHIVYTPKEQTLEESLAVMRQQMIKDNQYTAGIFIGGMEGIWDEYKIFKQFHPNTVALPIASTGAAARLLFNEFMSEFDPRLLNDYAYMSLFKDLLVDFI
jgi:hypothetical protein